MRPAEHGSLPDVWKAVWALVTRPPHLAVAVRLDQNMTKVSIELLMPLSLQLFSKQTDVGPLVELRSLLLWQTVSTTVYATDMPCRSACMWSAFIGMCILQVKLLKLTCQVRKHSEQTVTCVLPSSFRAFILEACA